MFTLLDGTGRQPRDAQLNVLKWLEENWAKADAFCILAPTAAGKSLIARSLQIEFDADLVTINNQLVKQYTDEYKKNGLGYMKATALVGRSNYAAPEVYNHAKRLSQSDCARSLVFNPISFCMYRNDVSHIPRRVIILDEADQHIGLLLEYATNKIKISDYEARVYNNTIASFLRLVEDRLASLRDKLNKPRRGNKVERDIAHLSTVKDLIKGNESAYGIDFETDLVSKNKYIKACPLFITKALARKLFGDAKVILLSGTLFKADVEDLLRGTKTVMYHEVESPIPISKRRIYYRPCDVEQSYGYDVDGVCDFVRELLEEIPIRPAILHTTYTDANKLAIRMPEVLVHNKNDKEEKLSEIERDRGTLFACGMSTGVNLNDDKCRLNVILKVRFPNQMSSFIKKRVALELTTEWHDIQALRETIQACGRATRGLEDFSVIVISDSRIIPLITRYLHILPKYFKESLVLEAVPIDLGDKK